jgi:hypothetical protein
MKLRRASSVDLIGRDDKKHSEFIERRQAPGSMGFVPGTLDEKTRSVEVVAATEEPAEVYDPARYEVVSEVLLMSGCEIPEPNSVPLTVEHYRSADAVIGSLRDMRTEGDQLIGRVFFSTSDDSEPYWIKVKEGHLDSFSITYPATGRVSVYVSEGESSVIGGKTYDGPILVTKQWTPKALGLVLFGADKNAKARHEAKPKTNRSKRMDPKLRAFLERCGLDKNATEAEAEAFMERFKVNPVIPQSVTATPKDTQEVDELTVRAEAASAERERVIEITAMCKRFACEDLIEDLVNDPKKTIDIARQQVMDRMVSKPAGDNPGYMPPVTVQNDERDKFRSAACDALIIRGDVAQISKPAMGAADLTGYTLRELARHALVVSGQPSGGNPLEMVGRALTTSDFPLILANVANRALMAGWDEAEETWREWCAAGSVSDFKTHSLPRASETDDLDEIPEGMPYKYGERAEAQEQYKIATYGKLFSLNRQTIINDDLGALTDIPVQHGEAAARKIGDVACAVLTANAAMGDGIALFHASHSNLSSGAAGAPSEATIGPAVASMRKQKDIKNKRRLNIRPAIFLAPVSIESASEIFFNSEMFTSDAKASTRKNIYGGTVFKRVYESRLDDDSVTAWYLLAKIGKTVKVFFLNGQQKPYMETKQGWSVDGVEYKVRIDCGAKALDWRGMNKNAGQ